MPRTCLVVGGGVAGLVAARTLAGEGWHVTVREASDRCGGALRADAVDAISVDLGAEAFAITRPETRNLIEELGLTIVEPRRTNARIITADGTFAMPHALLGIPTDPGSAEVRAIVGDPAADEALRLDSLPLQEVPTTLGALVRERMGDAVAERILAPVVSGVHAADPDIVEPDAVIPGLTSVLHQEGSLAAAALRIRSASGRPGTALAGLNGGMTTLVDALVRDCLSRGVRIETDSRVSRVRPEQLSWLVDGDAFDALIVAVDALTAARLLQPLPDVVDPLSRFHTGDVIVAAAVVESDALDADPVGSGVLVAPGHPQIRAKAMTHSSAKWDWVRQAYGPGRHLVRLSYGRDGVIDVDVDDLPAIVASDIAAICGVIPNVRDLRIQRWPASLVLPRPGHRHAVAQLRLAVEGHPTLAVVSAGIGGNGLAGTIAEASTVTRQLIDD